MKKNCVYIHIYYYALLCMCWVKILLVCLKQHFKRLAWDPKNQCSPLLDVRRVYCLGKKGSNIIETSVYICMYCLCPPFLCWSSFDQVTMHLALSQVKTIAGERVAFRQHPMVTPLTGPITA